MKNARRLPRIKRHSGEEVLAEPAGQLRSYIEFIKSQYITVTVCEEKMARRSPSPFVAYRANGHTVTIRLQTAAVQASQVNRGRWFRLSLFLRFMFGELGMPICTVNFLL
jgi:hypothetical protein